MSIAADQVLRLAGVLLIICAASAPAQQELNVGPWSAKLGAADLESLSYRGEPLIQSGAMRGYLPKWEGARFGMGGAELTVAEAGATWHKAEADNQEATLTLELAEQLCRYSLETTITAAGPSEYSVQIVPEAVQANEEHFLVWVDGEPRSLRRQDEFE